jgi:hypothetical protein
MRRGKSNKNKSNVEELVIQVMRLKSLKKPKKTT